MFARTISRQIISPKNCLFRFWPKEGAGNSSSNVYSWVARYLYVKRSISSHNPVSRQIEFPSPPYYYTSRVSQGCRSAFLFFACVVSKERFLPPLRPRRPVSPSPRSPRPATSAHNDIMLCELKSSGIGSCSVLQPAKLLAAAAAKDANLYELFNM